MANDYQAFSFRYCSQDDSNSCYASTFKLNYNYYKSYVWGGQKSGAYIFRPDDSTINGSIPYSKPISAKVYRGKNLFQIRIKNDRIITDLRIYNDIAKGIEIQSFVDSIPVDDLVGKEVVMLVEVPSINNNNIFYTDSMGMEMQKRKINFRPTWNLEVSQPVAGNYYPVLSTIYIEDQNTKERLAYENHKIILY